MEKENGSVQKTLFRAAARRESAFYAGCFFVFPLAERAAEYKKRSEV